MKTGFLFAGQGQQFLYMGQDLAAAYPEVKKLYARAESLLGYDVLTLDASQLNETRYTQPALYVLSVALDHVLKAQGFQPNVVAGLSLGEYSALVSAGHLDFESGLILISERAVIMQEAFEPFETGMAACVKTSREILEPLLADSGIEICNVNTPTQIVIGGRKDALDRVLVALKQEKVRAIPLSVSTVSHMSLMSDASRDLKAVLDTVNFQEGSIPFINNIHASLQTRDFSTTLAAHIAHPTELGRTIEKMRDMGVTQFIEVGPKGALAKCVKEICGDTVTVKTVYDVETLGV